MKRTLLCLIVTFCAVSFAHGDPTIRSLQQTLKDQGFYYGAVTGEKNTETTAAIRCYQIRNGLKVTGELNDETLRSLKPSSNSVAAESRLNSKPAFSQPTSGRPDVNGRVSQGSPPPSFNEPNRPLEINHSYAASFYYQRRFA
jgi:peptidoglycan hydrolase-like protein with peptidoglycan-binding domain